MAKERVLIIVESPKKAKTLGAFLKDADKKYDILASYGHIRDLIPKNGAVDIENNYEMHYEVVATQQKHVDKILKSAEKADSILLAPDPDREGEAIAWHIQTLLLASDPELAPKIARGYWHLGENGTVLDMIYAIRADEAEHRDVNHVVSGLKPDQPNPLYNPQDKFDQVLKQYVENMLKRGSD